MNSFETSFLQKNFIVNELLVLAWAASVQRANVYKKGQKPSDVQKFRRAVLDFVQALIPKYVDGCEEQAHSRNLQLLCQHATTKGAAILIDGTYRLGVAQKLLNLILKYLWCSGLIAEPPHCPVDRIVLDLGRVSREICWTRMESLDEYLLAIRSLSNCAIAEQSSLAHWELTCYQRRAGNFLDIERALMVNIPRLAVVA
ncbi:hypothetical protein NE850_38625 [Paraburkholderia sp. USG1]|uniref:hypothetical protein n=1 Tax=Paraburkholderia sp. USG1 TaxID=2952268 RepID=UPI0028575112|nr:hypothetical protein [Paraburkholderia sp. USG1]MDR8402236.1 hypothetical protein [Paraburkholderia sp. USG1]